MLREWPPGGLRSLFGMLTLQCETTRVMKRLKIDKPTPFLIQFLYP